MNTKQTLTKQNYPIENKEFIANMFMIGNGHIGYKGTMEEETYKDKVTLNICGVYDQFEDKWRESINIFNPLYFCVYVDGRKINYSENCIDHRLDLNIEEGIIYRTTKFKNLTLKTEKFISSVYDNVICSRIHIKVNKDIELTLESGIETEVYDINGPHYNYKKVNTNKFLVTGKTNEGHNVVVRLYEKTNYPYEIKVRDNKLLKVYNLKLKKGEIITIDKISTIYVDKMIKEVNYEYDNLKKEHIKKFSKEFASFYVSLPNDKETEFKLNYSMYQMFILGNENYATSIPARGLSGQVYKGAIFWDSEIFMLPFFLAHNEKIARQMLVYRKNTLDGAKDKAKKFGYKGAFYAWESQEDGKERCSLYNISDATSGKPIRTYFADKQIHISADILYGFINYFNYTGDFTLLDSKTINIFLNVYLFYKSYATYKDNKYHFYDVVGPDEYHERVNDNAFTNYHIYFTLSDFYKLLNERSIYVEELFKSVGSSEKEFNDFINNIYLPKPNKNNVIEQFAGYFSLKDVTKDELEKKVTSNKQYWGGENGIATNTRVIKQADVVCLLALYKDRFPYEVLEANYNFYTKYTEHGSSLSNSMYGILASILNKPEKYDYMIKSASIDLGTKQKLYAGGVFIGGTHPASNSGAFNILFYGILGAYIKDEKLCFNPKISEILKDCSLSYVFRGNRYKEKF